MLSVSELFWTDVGTGEELAQRRLVPTPIPEGNVMTQDASTAREPSHTPTTSLRETLPDTQPLIATDDQGAGMEAGIERYLDRALREAAEARAARWQPDVHSRELYEQSVQPNRERLMKIIGLVDQRVAPCMHLEVTVPLGECDGAVGCAPGYRILPVRWEVLPGVDAAGLLLAPESEPVADVIALPDAGQTPEQLAGLCEGIPPEAQYARRLAECGCQVLIPVVTDRDCDLSLVGGAPTVHPHREFIYRAAFELGRHIIGYEVQKVLAAVDWFVSTPGAGKAPVGVIGWGEGGLLALYAAAIDTRIAGAGVSGYFGPRENLWSEPLDRNVFGLLNEFGDAELASLVAPRGLVIEACGHPEFEVRDCAPEPARRTPGELSTPALSQVQSEVRRAQARTADLAGKPIVLVESGEGKGLPGSEAMLQAFLGAMDVQSEPVPSAEQPERLGAQIDPSSRRERQFNQLVEHTQHVMRECEFVRREYWAGADTTDLGTWEASCGTYRQRLWEDLIGKLPEPVADLNVRSTLIYDQPKYVGYEVEFDVYDEVVAQGILLVPKECTPAEPRPVVVCQHGLGGTSRSVADPEANPAAYHRYACQLAERGFVTYAPQNPYTGDRPFRGTHAFRLLQRKANPLGLTLYSFIVRQHQQTLKWLAALPFVDPERIAFYGLSYGGKVALRIPALLSEYCLSICSGDFNEWIWKNVSARHRHSYLTGHEFEMAEFDLGNTFNHAEMSWLIAPRPFMVERGHRDGCAPSEWVGYEYARTKMRYDQLGIGERTEIEWFDGPHEIHAEGTFDFLHRHLKWPKPERGPAGPG